MADPAKNPFVFFTDEDAFPPAELDTMLQLNQIAQKMPKHCLRYIHRFITIERANELLNERGQVVRNDKVPLTLGGYKPWSTTADKVLSFSEALLICERTNPHRLGAKCVHKRWSHGCGNEVVWHNYCPDCGEKLDGSIRYD